VRDGSAGQWRRLEARLAGRGVASLDEALREGQLEPVHAPLLAIFDGPHLGAILDGRATTTDLDVLQERVATFLAAVADATGVQGETRSLAGAIRQRTAATIAALDPKVDRVDRAALLAWLILSPMGSLAPAADVDATSAAWFDELGLAPTLAAGLRRAGLDDAATWAAADTIRVLLILPRPSRIAGRGRARDVSLLKRWLGLDIVRTAMGVTTSQGAEWLDRDRFGTLVAWAARIHAIAAGSDGPDRRMAERLLQAAKAADYRVDRLLAPAQRTRITPAAGPRSRSRPPTRPSGEP